MSSIDGPRRGRNGQAVFLVLGLLVVLVGLFFFLQGHSLHFRFTTLTILDEERAGVMADGASRLFWSFLEDVLRERKGCEALFPRLPSASPLHVDSEKGLEGFRLGPEQIGEGPKAGAGTGTPLEEALKRLRETCPEVSDLSAAAIWHVSPIHQGEDRVQVAVPRPNRPRSGRVDLRVTVGLRNTVRTFTYSRPFRLVNLLPIPTSKFTLFAKSILDGEGFNLARKHFQEDRGAEHLLVLRNSEIPFRGTGKDVWKRSGWVYLGGTMSTINLDGTHPSREQSEICLFWPDSTFLPSSQLPHVCSPAFPNTSLRVRVTPNGCMTDWHTDSLLKLSIGEGDATRLDPSSILRLFGDRNHLSPTRVVGNVRARYVLYSTLIFDRDGDGVADDLPDVAGQPQKGIFPLKRILDDQDYRPPDFPAIVNHRGFDLFAEAGGKEGIPESLKELLPRYGNGGESDYSRFMTRLSTDFPPGVTCFNALYDLMVRSPSTASDALLPAPRNFPETWVEDYPDQGKEFRLPGDQTFTPGSPLLFRGDLTSLDPALMFRQGELFTHRFGDQREFFKQDFLERDQGGLFVRQPVLALIEGDLDLTPGIAVAGPTLLVAKGDIRIGDARPATQAGKLVLVSLGGSILRSKAGSVDRNEPPDVQALVIASEGTFRWEGTLRMLGGLCVKTLIPADIARSGGTITYDRRNDPTDPEQLQGGYAVVLGPRNPVSREP